MKRLLLMTGAAAVAAVCQAGVKYWDNPDFKAFDVGDYVQDGLVLNYDGIRNAGPNAPHDSSAMTWVNCGSGGSDYDMTRYSTNGTKNNSYEATESAWNNDASKGAWTANGFLFGKDAIFHEMASLTIPTKYTIQSLVDATANDQNGIGYIMCDYNAGNWAACCVGIRASGGGTGNNACYLVCGNRPYFSASSGTAHFSYATIIHNETQGVMFPGTTAPWNATDGSYRSDLVAGPYTRENGISIGGHYPRTDELFNGAIKNFRLYNRCLSDEQVAWNRVVDEARYFGRRAAIPVTNVVVAVNIDGVADDHFALDAEGYTFTALASRTVKGRRYVLNGYKLETWDGSDWSSASSHSGDTCTISDTAAKVRLTWQYVRPEGEGYLVVYDVDDYVQEGLDWHYDGIRNVGADANHSLDTATWVNLGTSGSARDLTPYKWRNGDQGEWDADGYVFKGNSVYKFLSVPYTLPTTFTMQTLVDASIAGGQIDGYLNIYSGSYNKFSMVFSKYGNFCYANVQEKDRDGQPRFSHSSYRYDYATTILDGANRSQATFDGTTAPTSGDYTAGFRTFDEELKSYTLNDFRIGGYGAADGSLVGKIKSIRFYPNKILTTAELEQNRRVDEWRFFHRPPVTNVVVASTRAFLHGNESEGPWQVSGSYTFTAPASVTDRGITYEPAGYTIETWNGGEWSAPVAYTGASYAYSTGAGLVRLTWQWKATHGLRTAADYDVQDYVADGLVVNYDGIRNVGASASHDSSATKWVNLGSGGSTYDLTRYSLANSAWSANGSAGSWTDDGFVFSKNAVFHEWSQFVAPTRYAIQTLVDATANDQNGIGYVMCGYNADKWDNYSVGIRNSVFNNIANTFYLVCQGPTAGRPSICASSGTEHFSYATAMLDKTNGVMFAGTTAPWTASSENWGIPYGHAVSTATRPISYTLSNGYSIGGYYPSKDGLFKGTLKNYRFYDRVLTDDEVVWNRNVDSARYFGELATTNVFVVAGGGTQSETGAYKVEGSWDFTAQTVSQDGATKAVAGYWTEELSNGDWINKKWNEGTTYPYEEGTSPATVRLTWGGPRPGLMIFVK